MESFKPEWGEIGGRRIRVQQDFTVFGGRCRKRTRKDLQGMDQDEGRRARIGLNDPGALESRKACVARGVRGGFRKRARLRVIPQISVIMAPAPARGSIRLR